jgi:cytochrome P450
MTQASTWEQILDFSNRANPYPLYDELRRTPVARLADGSYLVSTYAEIAALLHDPRVSSDITRNPAAAAAGATAGDDEDGPGMTPTFLSMDPPDHDKFRRITMRHFGPPTTPGRVAGMEARMAEIVTDLVDNMTDQSRIDVVDDLAYPLPVTVICELLGVPPGDEQRFRVWVDVALQSTDPGLDPETQQEKRAEAGKELRAFMEELVEAHRRTPGPDLLSAMATDDGPEGRLPDEQLVSTGLLLLIAGHETTVNLISNGALTMLRHPAELQRLRNDPGLAIPMVED